MSTGASEDGGILELADLCDFEEKELFLKKAGDMMKALQDKCWVDSSVPAPTGILAHAVYGFPQNSGIDECCIWGDYFYMEALMRMSGKDWDIYWA